jgi:hypothetical protein
MFEAINNFPYVGSGSEMCRGSVPQNYLRRSEAQEFSFLSASGINLLFYPLLKCYLCETALMAYAEVPESSSQPKADVETVHMPLG